MVLSSRIIANVASQFHPVHLSIRTLPFTTPYIYIATQDILMELLKIFLWYERFSSATFVRPAGTKIQPKLVPFANFGPLLKM